MDCGSLEIPDPNHPSTKLCFELFISLKALHSFADPEVLGNFGCFLEIDVAVVDSDANEPKYMNIYSESLETNLEANLHSSEEKFKNILPIAQAKVSNVLLETVFFLSSFTSEKSFEPTIYTVAWGKKEAEDKDPDFLRTVYLSGDRASTAIDSRTCDLKHIDQFEHEQLGMFLFLVTHKAQEELLEFSFFNRNPSLNFRLFWNEKVAKDDLVSLKREVYYGEFLDQDPFDETKKTHNEVILLKIKDREFLLEFHPTDPNDRSQNLYELIGSNKHFSLDEKLTSLNNLTYYFQTKGQEDHRIQLD